jgi:hypothetical protein
VDFARCNSWTRGSNSIHGYSNLWGNKVRGSLWILGLPSIPSRARSPFATRRAGFFFPINCIPVPGSPDFYQWAFRRSLRLLHERRAAAGPVCLGCAMRPGRALGCTMRQGRALGCTMRQGRASGRAAGRAVGLAAGRARSGPQQEPDMLECCSSFLRDKQV